jgi:hypothetical protein
MKIKRYAKVRKVKSYAKTRKAMKNTKTRKAMSHTKSTKAMKHIEKKTTHQKNITENISITVVATMSPITTTITIIHYAQAQIIPTKRKQKN